MLQSKPAVLTRGDDHIFDNAQLSNKHANIATETSRGVLALRVPGSQTGTPLRVIRKEERRSRKSLSKG